MKILVAGDFCPRDRVARIFEKGDYASVFGDVKVIVSQVDYSIVNLECPVVNGNGTPIKKCGPNLKTTAKGVEALKWTGFNCVTLANNHFYDYGDEGVKSTLEACGMNGIDTVGGGSNLVEASKILYKQLGGQTLAIVNCCEHEFSIATDTTGGSNPLNPIQQYYAIQEAKSKSDYVLVIVHGGHEHWQLPSPRMVETYRFFIDAGADAVVNHHQHCYSGYELYKGKPIFYGIGNFCFDRQGSRNNAWNEGFMVMIDFGIQVRYECYPYRQCDAEPNVSFFNVTDSSLFQMIVNKLNNSILDNEGLHHAYMDYLCKDYKYVLLGFEPYNNSRLVRSLYLRRLLPSFLSRKKINWLINYIECESHYSRVLAALKQKLVVKNEDEI